jgi:DNA-binding Lrp family transcriptional regulator
MDETDRAILHAVAPGLPPVPRPYHALADRLGLDAEDVMRRLTRLRDTGAIRRIAAVPNHYRLGYRANGMSVWDVDDERVDELGARVGALPFVSHCYRRPRVMPHWPYNLFAMVHAGTRAAAMAHADAIAAVLGDALRGRDILFSAAILKKTGMRFTD